MAAAAGRHDCDRLVASGVELTRSWLSLRWLPRWSLAIGDQGLVALLNLALSIIVTQVSGLANLGTFTVITTTINLSMGVARLLVTDPWAASRVAPSTAAPELRWLVALAAMGAAVLTGAVSVISGGGDRTWLWAIPIAAAVVVQDFGRYLCFRVEDTATAMGSDLAVVGTATVVFALAIAFGHGGLEAILIAWLTGLLAGTLALGSRLFGPVSARGSGTWWRTFCRGLATRLAFDTAAYMLGVSGSLYLLAYLGTSRDVGLVRVVQTLFSPAALVVTGLTMWMVPYLAHRSPSDALRLRSAVTWWMSAAGVPLIAAAVLVGPWFARLVFGIHEAPTLAALTLAGLSTAAMGVASPWLAAARVSGRYLPIAWSRTVAAVVTVTGIATVGALRSTAGYLGLLALQNVTVAGAAVMTVRTEEPRRRRDHIAW